MYIFNHNTDAPGKLTELDTVYGAANRVPGENIHDQ